MGCPRLTYTENFDREYPTRYSHLSVIRDTQQKKSQPKNTPPQSFFAKNAKVCPVESLGIIDLHYSDYRYGFNGMEKDNEIKGSGNSYTTMFRQYDPRLGRWLTLDPLLAKFPHISGFAAFANNPIYFVDPKGLAPDGPGDEKKEDTDTNTDEPELDETQAATIERYLDYAFNEMKNSLPESQVGMIKALISDGNARLNYSAQVKKLGDLLNSQAISGETYAMVRYHLQKATKMKLSFLGKVISEAPVLGKPLGAQKAFAESIVKDPAKAAKVEAKGAPKSRPITNVAAKSVNVAAKGLFVYAVYSSAETIANSDDKLKATAQEALKWTAASAGSEGGMALGACTGPFAPVCVPLFGMIGGAIGWISADAAINNSGGHQAYDPYEDENGWRCFRAGTLVKTVSGYKAIENLVVGDTVFSFNIETKLNEKSIVITNHKRVSNSINSLVIGDYEIFVTDEHPFYHNNKGWITVKEMEVGDSVLTANGDIVPVNYKTRIDSINEVYNLSVSGNKNYYITQLEILVHNKECFLGNSKVIMSNNSEMEIDEISVGDSILCLSIEGEYVSDIVVQVSKVYHSNYYRIIFDDSTSIVTTGSHPFYNSKMTLLNIHGDGNINGVSIERLSIGSEIKSYNIIKEVRRIEQILNGQYSYNISVGNGNNYFIDGVLVSDEENLGGLKYVSFVYKP